MWFYDTTSIYFLKLFTKFYSVFSIIPDYDFNKMQQIESSVSYKSIKFIFVMISLSFFWYAFLNNDDNTALEGKNVLMMIKILVTTEDLASFVVVTYIFFWSYFKTYLWAQFVTRTAIMEKRLGIYCKPVKWYKSLLFRVIMLKMSSIIYYIIEKNLILNNDHGAANKYPIIFMNISFCIVQIELLIICSILSNIKFKYKILRRFIKKFSICLNSRLDLNNLEDFSRNVINLFKMFIYITNMFNNLFGWSILFITFYLYLSILIHLFQLTSISIMTQLHFDSGTLTGLITFQTFNRLVCIVINYHII